MKLKKVLASLLAASMVLGNAALPAMAVEDDAEYLDEEYIWEDDELSDEEDYVEADASEEMIFVEDVSSDDLFVEEEDADDLLLLEEDSDGQEEADGLLIDDESGEGDDAAQEEAVYVLMNIPYSDFYAAEGISGVDAVSSSTFSKPLSGSLAGGSYHVHSDGSDISGIIYPVKVSSLDQLSGLTQVTEEDSFDITVTNRGQETTTTYAGKDALFQSEDYSYYVLSEAPIYYKELQVAEDGSMRFGAVQGTVTTVTGAAASEISYYTHHCDIEITLSGTAGIDSNTVVSGVIVTTSDGESYALRHVENIWLRTELGWNKDAVYDLDGKTITNIRYYTQSAVIDYPVSIEVKTMVKDAAAVLDGQSLTITGLPEDAGAITAAISYTTGSGRTAVTTTVAEDIEVKDGALTLPDDLTEETTYTVSLNNDTYAINSVSFVYQNAVQAEETYVLMNIPYSDFYAAEGISGVDAVSSSTYSKPLSGSLAGGSYHVHSDGSDISGIIYPVKVSSLDQLSGLTQVTDEDSFDITVTNRGQETTTTYAGKDALFQSADYSYYVLSETPTYYKELQVAGDGSMRFGAVQGTVTTVAGAAASEISYYTHHCDIEITLSGTAGIDSNTVVSGVIVTTSDGESYALRHVENIWLRTKLGWNKDAVYDLDGKTITNIRYYTQSAVIDYPVTITVNKMVKEAAAAQNGQSLTITGLPENVGEVTAAISYTTGSGRNAVTTTVAENIVVTDGSLTIPDGLTEGETYTVSLSSGQYAIKAVSFVYGSTVQDETEDTQPSTDEAQTDASQNETEGSASQNGTTSSQTQTSAGETKENAADSEAAVSSDNTAQNAAQPESETESVILTKSELKVRATASTKTTITLKWNKVSGADGYLVYGAKASTKSVKQIADVTKTSYKQTKLKKGTYYKYRVDAYKVVNGKKVVISDTNVVYRTTTGGKKTNVKSIKLNKKKVTLKKGKTFKLKVTTKNVSAKKETKTYAAVRFTSSDKSVAKVSSKGKITAVKKGTCTIYATTQEGLTAKIKVTVK